MTIYIDTVFIENIIMDSIILIASSIILKQKISYIRIIIASSIGAIYTIIAYISKIEIYQNIILKLILSVAMIYIAYNPQTIRKMWKQLIIFYLTSFVFGGVTFASMYVIKPQNLMQNKEKITTLSAIIAFIILITAFKIVKNKIDKKDMICEIEIKINNNTIKTKAMIDTGNLLKEPITNTPVIIVEHTLLYECFPKEILNNLNQIIGGDLEKIPEEIKKKYIPKLKLIPFSSLGKTNGILIGIKAEQIKIIQDEQETTKQNIIIGIYNKSLTKKGEYRALLGLEIMEGK